MKGRGLIALIVGLAACGAPSDPPPPTTEATVTIAFGGDVNLGRRQNALTARDGADAALGGVHVLREADIAVANLESVVSSIGASGVDKGEDAPFYFRGRPEMLDMLVAGGIDAVATANNHSGDYGPEALAEQARLLDAAGIAHAGSGPGTEAACAPALIGAGGLVIAVLSVDATMPHFAADAATTGTCHLALSGPEAWRERIGPILAEAHEHAHVVLVAVHWGANLATEPSAAKRAVGRLLVDLGADAVLGSSAHVLQGIEIHDGRPILHDAGNLLFDSQEGTVDSAVFVLEVDARGVVGVQVEPMLSAYGATHPAAGDDRARILTRMASLSENLGTEVVDGRLELAPPSRREPDSPGTAPSRTPALSPPASAPPPGCVVDDVPAGHRVDPLQLGDLTLVGAAVEPVHAGSLAWVDSYWRVESRVARDLWLSPRLEPLENGETWRGDHEPCDWAWPTSRLERGQIYHDRAPLRPHEGTTGALVLRMAVTDGSEQLAISGELLRVRVEGD